ncbi:MAG: coproporphyrinogen III oxidase family protein, partial [Geobacteraceae bacterium]|nr:coproporphyrinogen III oxidase family protein [Geobacteraceae bacterium]
GYWRRDGYLGLGVAAHSLLRREHGYRFSNHDTPEEYGLELTACRLPRRDQHLLTLEDAMAEFMFLGLRLADGVLAEDFKREFGLPLRSVYGTVIDELLRTGLLQQERGALRLTRRALLLSNRVFARFLP